MLLTDLKSCSPRLAFATCEQGQVRLGFGSVINKDEDKVFLAAALPKRAPFAAVTFLKKYY